MKILFRTLDPIKKEAVSIRKIINKHRAHTKCKLQPIQDLVARFYGWQHYNEMSHHHNDFMTRGLHAEERPRLADIFGSGPGQILLNIGHAKFDVKLITGINDLERIVLEQRKKHILSEYLRTNNIDESDIMYEVFDKRSALEKLRQHFTGNYITSLDQIGFEISRRHFFVMGQCVRSAAQYYSDQAIKNASTEGGFFILRKSVYEELRGVTSELFSNTGMQSVVYDLTESVEKGVDENHVQSDLGGLSILRNPNLREVEAAIVSAIKNIAKYDELETGRPSGYDTDMWINRSASIWMAFMDSVRKQEFNTLIDAMDSVGFDPKTLSSETILDKAEKLFIKFAYQDEEPCKLKKVLLDLPGFDADKALAGEDQSERTLEMMGYNAMSIFHALSSFNSTEFDNKTHLTDAFIDGKAIFVVIGDKYDVTHVQAQSYLYAFRSTLAPMLGDYLEKVSESAVVKKQKVKGSSTPVVLDAYDGYPIKGMAVVAAQCRSMGLSVSFGFTDIKFGERHDPEETMASIANSSSIVLLDNKIDEHLELVKKRVGMPMFNPDSRKHESLELDKIPEVPTKSLMREGDYVYVSLWKPTDPWYHEIIH